MKIWMKEFAHVLVNKIFSFLFSFGNLPFKRQYCTVKSSRKVSMNPLLHERLQLWCPAFLFMNFCYVTLLRRVFILLQILYTNCSSSTIEYTFFLRLLQPLCCDLRSRWKDTVKSQHQLRLTLCTFHCTFHIIFRRFFMHNWPICDPVSRRNAEFWRETY